MKVNVEIDCTPAEARAFFGLPDVSGLNEHMVEEMKKRLDANLAMAAPEELMKTCLLYRRMCARLSVGKSLDDPETVDELIQAARR